MAEYVSAHINLFGAWDPKFTPQQVFARAEGTDQIRSLIEYVLDLQPEGLTEAAIGRFAEISPQELYLPVVPDEQRLVQRLLRPLKSSKRLYCLGEFLGTIALAGLVGETLAMLAFRMRKIQLDGKALDGNQEQQLFGKEFDKLDQSRRIEILDCFGVINAQQKQQFSDLRGTRNKYLHLWEVDDSQIQGDARKSFLHAMRIFKEISNINVDLSGAFTMNPALLEYVRSDQAG